MKQYHIHLYSLIFLLAPVQVIADLEVASKAYEQGDYKTALTEFSRLANEGNSAAQYNLAFMFYGGEGVEQNHIKAFYWFEIAAKSGYSRAQDILGYMYSHGYGVEANRIRAYIWYSLAASNGIYLATEVRDTLASEMGQAERSQAELLTREYIKKYLKPNMIKN